MHVHYLYCFYYAVRTYSLIDFYITHLLTPSSCSHLDLSSSSDRFVASLHLIFDYTKATGSYDENKRPLNGIEETLAVVLPALPGAVVEEAGVGVLATKGGSGGMKITQLEVLVIKHWI